MKTALSGALALCLSFSLASAQPAPNKTEAQVIVDKCRAAYAALNSYSGTVKTHEVTLADGKQEIGGGTARIVFKRPNLMRIDGKLDGGGDYSILGNADGSWYRWPVENEGAWKKSEDLDLAVAVMTGVASGAPTDISSLLVPALGVDAFHLSESAKIEGDEAIEGQLCTKLTARAKETTISWWIDKKTWLLRRKLESYDEKQSAAMLEETYKDAEESLKQAGKPVPPRVNLRFVSDREDFEIETTDEAVDETLFATPDKAWPWLQAEEK